MKKIFITAIALLGTYTIATATDINGSTPKNGDKYNLYNVGTKQFLGTEDGRLTLGGEKLEVTLELIEDTKTPGFFRLKTSEGTLLGANIWGAPSTEGGTYTEWRIEPTSPYNNTYTLSSRNTEASASMYLYQSAVYNRLAAMPQMPGADFAAAQWLLVSNSVVPDIAIYDFKEDDAVYNKPQTTTNQMEANLYRSFVVGKWNIFCSPISLNEVQMKEMFGEDVRVAEFTGVERGELKFTTVYNINAGEPYIIRFTGEPKEKYTILGDLEFALEAGSVEQGDITFYGTLCNTTIDNKAYGFDLTTDALVRLNKESVGGMNGYFVPKYATTEITSWSLDGISTSINAVNSDASAADVYNVGGQKVGTTKSTDGLQRGIYIVKGKKTSKN